MLDAKAILEKMLGLLKDNRLSLQHFIEEYATKKASIWTPPDNIEFQAKPIPIETLRKFFEKGYGIIQKNIEEVNRIILNLETQKQTLDKSRFESLSYYARGLCSRAGDGFTSVHTADGRVIEYTDHISYHVYRILEGYEKRFDNLYKKLLRAYKFNNKAKIADFEIHDCNELSSIISSCANHQYIQLLKINFSSDFFYGDLFDIFEDEEFLDVVSSAPGLFSIEIVGVNFPERDILVGFIVRFECQLNKLGNDRDLFIKMVGRGGISLYFFKELGKQAKWNGGESQIITEDIASIATQDNFELLIAFSNIPSAALNVVTGDGTLFPADAAILRNNIYCWKYLEFVGEYSELQKSKGIVTTVLHLAVEYASEEILLRLSRNEKISKMKMLKGAARKYQFTGGATPLQLAICRGDLSIVKALFYDYSVEITSTDVTLAFDQNKFDIVMFCMGEGVKLEDGVAEKIKFLTSSAGRGQVDKQFKLFLNEREEPFLLMKSRNPIQALQDWCSRNKIENINNYLDFENHTLLFRAMRARDYEVYGFLISVGAVFSSTEAEARDFGNPQDKVKFRSSVIKYLPSIGSDVVAFLVSCTHVRNSSKGNVLDIRSFYQKLLKHSYIAPVLQVLEYANPKPMIIVDAISRQVGDVAPVGEGDQCLGQFNKPSHVVYVAANNEGNGLGVLAHELAHFACKIVFDNDSFPYSKDDQKNQKEMKGICDNLYEHRYDSKFADLFTNSTRMLKIFSKVFPLSTSTGFSKGYDASEWPKELVVRVSEVMALYDKRSTELDEKQLAALKDDGTSILEEHVSKLLNYYKKVFLSACVAYVAQKKQQGMRSRLELLEDVNVPNAVLSSEMAKIVEYQPVTEFFKQDPPRRRLEKHPDLSEMLLLNRFF